MTTFIGDWGVETTGVLAAAAWRTSTKERVQRFHAQYFCPTRNIPYSDLDPAATQVHGACRAGGCLDYFHELLTRVLHKLARRTHVKQLASYATRVAQAEIVELRRAERTAMGFAARPTRTDGVPGRVAQALDAQDPTGWLRRLFRIMRSCPFSPHHVPGQWPIEGLRAELQQHHPAADDCAQRIRQDIKQVMRIATEIAGKDWVYEQLTLPVITGRAAAPLPSEPPAQDSVELDEVLHAQLRGAYTAARSAGMSPHTALARAAMQVTGLPLPRLDRETRSALADLDLSLAAAHRQPYHDRTQR